jgi:signal recognition particle subunit SRP54
MKQVEDAVNPDETIFVMDSSIGQACKDQATAFKDAVRVGSVIVTKLDGHSKGGGAISAVSATNSPIIFIGTGEHFDDFESFNSESFVRRLLGLGDLKRLFEVIKDVVPADSQPELLESLMKKNFSLKTMQTLYNSTLSLGPMNQFMSMIPGIGNQLAGAMNEKEGVNKIKRYLCIMDSMTQEELSLKAPIDEFRKRRLARGSGVHPDWITQLLEEFKQTKKIIESMGSMGLAGKNGKFFFINHKRPNGYDTNDEKS